MLLYLFKYLFELFILLILYGLHIVKALYKQKKKKIREHQKY